MARTIDCIVIWTSGVLWWDLQLSDLELFDRGESCNNGVNPNVLDKLPDPWDRPERWIKPSFSAFSASFLASCCKNWFWSSSAVWAVKPFKSFCKLLDPFFL